MSELVRIRDDLIISTNEIKHVTPGGLTMQDGIGYSISPEIYDALCRVALPRSRWWHRFVTARRST